MDYREKFKKEVDIYFKDIDTCITLLESLKSNYTTPGVSTMINKSKVQRVRLVIHDLLKKY